MNIWSNKKILLGVSASIAAYKSILLLRELQELGAEVRVVMTPAAEKLIGSATFVALTRSPVLVVEQSTEDYFTHIDWARWADLFVLAPATANTINTLAAGLTPNALSLLWLCFDKIKAIVPAMNPSMYFNAATQESIDKMIDRDVKLIEPGEGLMACGETGLGRFPETKDIIEHLEVFLMPEANLEKVLITAGRTEEAIDPVRYISNRSSGALALEIAKTFRQMGHPVTVISGPCDVEWPSYVELLKVKSSQQMYDSVRVAFRNSNVLIMNAAVADYRPKEVSEEKIKGSRDFLSIELTPNPDILKEMSELKSASQITIGFALETESHMKFAQEKISAKGCDILVLNLPVSKEGVFSSAQMEVSISNQNQSEGPELKLMTRKELATNLYQAYSDYKETKKEN